MFETSEKFFEALAEVRAEGEIECRHCGGVPDGTIEIKTDSYTRNHRICNKCATAVLEWL